MKPQLNHLIVWSKDRHAVGVGSVSAMVIDVAKRFLG